MELTRSQEQGVKIAVDRYREKEKYTCIAGYAGTGKSTVVAHIISRLGLSEGEVCYIAFTGKASLVLERKGCTPAMTAHRLLYDTYVTKEGTYVHKEKNELNPKLKVVVWDEISMGTKPMWDLIMSHDVHVIALGDPGQLPPIGESNGVLDKPHVFFSEIMRQAAESEIIRLTSDIREGKALKVQKGEEVQILSKREECKGLYLWGDQIIAGKNTTRNNINSIMREYLHGIDPMNKTPPQEGERVIALKNEWEMQNICGDNVINGMQGTIHNIQIYDKPYGLIDVPMTADFLPDFREGKIKGEAFQKVPMDYQLFTTHVPLVGRDNFNKFKKNTRPREFDFGYCITCHKSQGSEYSKVLVFEERLNRATHKQWLYTAATRAIDKLVIIKDT